MCTAADDGRLLKSSPVAIRPLYVTHPSRISSGVQIVSPNSPPHHQARLFRGREPVRGIGSHSCTIPSHAVSKSPRFTHSTPKSPATLPGITKSKFENSTIAERSRTNDIDQTFALTASLDVGTVTSASATANELEHGLLTARSHNPDSTFASEQRATSPKETDSELLLRSPSKSRRRIAPLPTVNYIGCDTSSAGGSLYQPGENMPLDPQTGADIGFVVLAKKAGEQKVKEIVKNLDHSNLVSRWEIVKTLSQITVKGDRVATEAIAAKLEHSDEAVRNAAMQALKAVTLAGDVFAIDSVADRLEHPDEHVRSSAMYALPYVTKVGCVNAISSVSAKLTHDDAIVRQSAAKALHFIAERGDPNVIDSISMRLSHENEGVRQAAVTALTAMSHNASTLASLLEDPNPCVRWDAVRKFGDCIEKGDRSAISAILPNFSSSRAEVRKAAVAALSKVVSPADREAIELVVSLLEDPYEHVRNSAIEALKLIVGKGNVMVIKAVAERLENTCVSVRQAATKALVAIARPGDKDVVRAVAEHLGHESEDVRLSTGRCLARLAIRGHKVAISSVSPFLHYEDPHVRATAVKALGRLVDKANSLDVALVMSRFSDPDCHVRCAAVAAMKSILEASTSLVATPNGMKLLAQSRPTLLLQGHIDFKACSYVSERSEQQQRLTLPAVEEDALNYGGSSNGHTPYTETSNMEADMMDFASDETVKCPNMSTVIGECE